MDKDTMSTEETLRVFECYKGTGKIYKGEQFLAEVDYFLKEVEQVLDPTLLVGGPTLRLAGERNICGILESPQVELLYEHLASRLRLHFQDGRLLDFTVSKELGKDICLIQSLADFPKRP